jgi:TolA-binding protein
VEEKDELGPLEQGLMRNSFCFKGAALFDLGRYDEAIQVYSSVTNRYQQSPEVLEAYLRIAACYRRLGRMTEFRGTLERAKIVVKRLPEDAPYAALTSHTREDWKGLLEWWETL